MRWMGKSKHGWQSEFLWNNFHTFWILLSFIEAYLPCYSKTLKNKCRALKAIMQHPFQHETRTDMFQTAAEEFLGGAAVIRDGLVESCTCCRRGPPIRPCTPRVLRCHVTGEALGLYADWAYLLPLQTNDAKTTPVNFILLYDPPKQENPNFLLKRNPNLWQKASQFFATTTQHWTNSHKLKTRESSADFFQLLAHLYWATFKSWWTWHKQHTIHEL